MKFRHVLYVILGLVAISFAWSNLGEKSDPHSPKRIILPQTLDVPPGSGHAFGFGVVYTIVAHKKYAGRTYAVIKSDEPDVEIWSPLLMLVALKDGSSFHFTEGSSFDKSLHTISDKDH